MAPPLPAPPPDVRPAGCSLRDDGAERGTAFEVGFSGPVGVDLRTPLASAAALSARAGRGVSGRPLVGLAGGEPRLRQARAGAVHSRRSRRLAGEPAGVVESRGLAAGTRALAGSGAPRRAPAPRLQRAPGRPLERPGGRKVAAPRARRRPPGRRLAAGGRPPSGSALPAWDLRGGPGAGGAGARGGGGLVGAGAGAAYAAETQKHGRKGQQGRQGPQRHIKSGILLSLQSLMSVFVFSAVQAP